MGLHLHQAAAVWFQVKSIYFDYNATTPLDPEVRRTIVRCLEKTFGNPSSQHRHGHEARVLLDDCRHRIASLLRCKPSELVFTSGGTESNNLAILGAARLARPRGLHLITSPTEHHSVLNCFDYLAREEGFQVTYLPVNDQGVISPDDLLRSIRPHTTLVSVMAANNETGTLQPISELGSLCQERGILFHTDAAQTFGKLADSDLQRYRADLVSLCSHKFHGPRGAGVLFIRSPLRLASILHGGSQEDERRPGTENLPAIVGLTEAIHHSYDGSFFPQVRLQPLVTRLSSIAESIPDVSVVSNCTKRLPNTVSFTIKGCINSALIAALDLEGICISGGSACSTGALVPSHVLLAMGYAKEDAKSFVRFSFGRENTLEEVDFCVGVLPHLINRVRAANNL